MEDKPVAIEIFDFKFPQPPRLVVWFLTDRHARVTEFLVQRINGPGSHRLLPCRVHHTVAYRSRRFGEHRSRRPH